MIYWAPFLHMYQPPTQYYSMLDKIVKESYLPLLKVFHRNPKAKLTINICGVLTEMLAEYRFGDVLKGFNELIDRGQIELVGTSKYHAILPLIPASEVQRQINLNNETNSYYFKSSHNPKGFFLPEMCYSDESADIVTNMGYEWIIVSGVSCKDKWPLDVIYSIKLKSGSIRVFYRDDIISNRISFKQIDAKGFIANLRELKHNKTDIYIITAMDAETFGHHIKGWEHLFLEQIFKMVEGTKIGREIKIVNVSDLMKKFSTVKSEPPYYSSWSTTKEEIQKGNFYPLWKDPDNNIHALQWEHMNICIDILKAAESHLHSERSKVFFDMSRVMLDKALHSCQFWWANKSRMWGENMVNKGLMFQEEAIFTAYKSVVTSHVNEEEKMRLHNEVLRAREVAGRIREALF